MTAEVDWRVAPAASFRSPYLRGVRFELRPIECGAPENWVGIMYRRLGNQYRQAGAGIFREGRWLNARKKPLSGEGLH